MTHIERFSDEDMEAHINEMGKFMSECKVPGCRHGRINGTDCDCFKIARYRAEMLMSGLPLEYCGFKMKNLEDLIVHKDVKKFMNRYLEHAENAFQTGKGAVFIGERGGGKTTCMAMIAKKALSLGYGFRYILAPKLIDLYYNNKEEFHRLSHPSNTVMLIDEFDKVAFKADGDGNTQKVMDFITRAILPNQKTLFIGTNLETKELDDKIKLSSLLERYCVYVSFTDVGAVTQRRNEYWDSIENGRKFVDFYDPDIVQEARTFYDVYRANGGKLK